MRNRYNNIELEQNTASRKHCNFMSEAMDYTDEVKNHFSKSIRKGELREVKNILSVHPGIANVILPVNYDQDEVMTPLFLAVMRGKCVCISKGVAKEVGAWGLPPPPLCIANNFKESSDILLPIWVYKLFSWRSLRKSCKTLI